MKAILLAIATQRSALIDRMQNVASTRPAAAKPTPSMADTSLIRFFLLAALNCARRIGVFMLSPAPVALGSISRRSRGARAWTGATIGQDWSVQLRRAFIVYSWRVFMARIHNVRDHPSGTRLFESEGTTFTEYVLAQRLVRAHRLLTDARYAGEKISAIALDAGFGDVSYFNRVFRRRYGVAPSELRVGARSGN